jgi:hypothetical protein
MTRKPRKPQASKREYHAALVPIRWRGEATPECDRPILMAHADKDEQQTFYRALLELPWLAPGIRSAIMRKFGGRLHQEEKTARSKARLAVLRVMVDEVKARMRKNGERPDLGIDHAAHEEVARAAGMKGSSLQRELDRLDHPRPKKRGKKAAEAAS